MNRRFQACLVSLMMGAISSAVFAQSGANVPSQRGVRVQLAVTTNAVGYRMRTDKMPWSWR